MRFALTTFIYNGHRIDIEYSWTGREKILYDGQVMSDKRSLFGATHVFQVYEDGDLAQYTVEFSAGSVGPNIRVHRNNYLIFSNKEGFKPPPPPPKTQESKTIVEKTREIVMKEIILVVCPNCNHRNESSRRSCENCGASI